VGRGHRQAESAGKEGALRGLLNVRHRGGVAANFRERTGVLGPHSLQCSPQMSDK
jgi:hypothetical protein